MNPQDFTLLVVDDEEMNRDVLTRRLVRLGYQVAEARNGDDAINLIRNQRVDLVLLDVMMPGMDGLEVLTTIRETHSLVDLPVIMATARDQSGDVVAALQLGANDYVTKPINFPLALARIQTHLAIKNTHSRQLATVNTGVPKTGGTRPTLEIPELRVQTLPAAGETVESASRTHSGTSSGERRPRIGDYEVLEELGRGGMGVVYKARHQRMNRLVALKVIDREFLAKETSVQRFYQEIQAAAQLSHSNIVLAYDAGQFGDTHYFAMEFCEGQDLSKLVRTQGPLAPLVCCDYMRQVALGLQHAHERGFVHRDIKPSNLIVTGLNTATPVVKILDLGLARIHQPSETARPSSELTREGVVIGSVDYMAPEQWLNASKVDIRADLYSVGCVFYFLLTGRVPFPAEEPMEKMLKHHLDEPTPVEQIRMDVPPRVTRVVKRLLGKKPEQRYQTPNELAELLKWILQTPLDESAV